MLLDEHDVKLVELALAALFMGPPDTAVIAFCGLTGDAWLSRRYEPTVGIEDQWTVDYTGLSSWVWEFGAQSGSNDSCLL